MSAIQRPALRHKQLVTAPPSGVTPDQALTHFERKLAFETDPSDVYHDLTTETAQFVVVDARQRSAYQACRIPGSIHLSQGKIRRETTRHLDPETLIITYCWGPGCNGSTKAAAKLSALGFTVREMIGGIEYWRREGYPVEGELGDDAPFAAP